MGHASGRRGKFKADRRTSRRLRCDPCNPAPNDSLPSCNRAVIATLLQGKRGFREAEMVFFWIQQGDDSSSSRNVSESTNNVGCIVVKSVTVDAEISRPSCSDFLHFHHNRVRESRKIIRHTKTLLVNSDERSSSFFNQFQNFLITWMASEWVEGGVVLNPSKP